MYLLAMNNMVERVKGCFVCKAQPVRFWQQDSSKLASTCMLYPSYMPNGEAQRVFER
jgi:hypothetical protein